MRNEPRMLRVKNDSTPKLVGAAIAGQIRTHGRALVQAIGAGAVHQATKGVACAGYYLAADGLIVWMIPSFVALVIDGQECTAIRFLVESAPKEQCQLKASD